MAMLHALRSLFRTIRRRSAFEDAMDDEMRFHLEARTADLVRRGLSPADAVRRARLEFGSIEKQKDLARAGVGLRIVDDIAGDVRYALRTFAHNKSFTGAALVTLALGIGANAAIFSLIEALMLRSLPVPRVHELQQLKLASPGGSPGSASATVSYPLIRALDARGEIFSAVGGFSDTGSFTTTLGGSFFRVPGSYVTGGFYDALGLQPAMGRLLGRADDTRGAPVVVVISYRYWERQFARDPAIVGRTISLNGIPAEIVGVSPSGFTGANVGRPADLTLAVAAIDRVSPLAAGLMGPGNWWLRVLARVRDPLTPEAARARVAAVWPAIAADAISPEWPEKRKLSVTAASLEIESGSTGWTFLREMYAKPLQVLMVIVAVVLLIACANVASLLLARASARRREFAIRLALGAGRGRIIRQLLVESLLLSSSGAAFGILLAWASSRFLVGVISTRGLTVAFDLQPNWRVAAFAAFTAIATALLFGLAPALQSTADGPAGALKDDVRSGSTRTRLLPSLVVVQVALSLILLIGAGLFVRTLRNLQTLNPGFHSQGVLLVRLDSHPGSLPGGLIDDVRRIPGVIEAGVSTHTPLSGATWSEPAVPAELPLPDRDTAVFIGASPGFFSALQIPMAAGRAFTQRDTREAPAVAIVNERYAGRYFPGVSPLGRRLGAVVRGERRTLEIVGVARNTNTAGLRRAAPLTVYVPYHQLTGDVPSTIVARVSGRMQDVTPALQRILQPLTPADPIDIVPLATQISGTLTQERLMAALGGGFGVLALALASVGIYGLLAYGVARRRREIGIRMALGARHGRVVRLVLSSAWWPLAAGVALGLPAAWIAARWIESMLFGLSATDPTTIAAAVLTLATVAHLAAWLPARRAARVDPLLALKCE
jgi:putative ABC transport system permease protein